MMVSKDKDDECIGCTWEKQYMERVAFEHCVSESVSLVFSTVK